MCGVEGLNNPLTVPLDLVKLDYWHDPSWGERSGKAGPACKPLSPWDKEGTKVGRVAK